MSERDLNEGKISPTKEVLRKKWDASLFFSLHQQWILLILALFLLGSLTFKFYYHPRPTSSGDPVKETAIEVLGEVRQPGIYLFQNPPNLKEALERAGGLKETAQFDTTFSSKILQTGTLLTVVKESSQIHRSPPQSFPPPPGERKKRDGPLLKEERKTIKQDEIKIRIGRMAANKLLVFSIPLDLNNVSAEDLCLIPGIGESLAQEIIAHRERRKRFRSVDELRNVKGIGEKKYNTIRGFFTAG
jgi:competence ComEA-like helix-hairpin-helix protein